MDSRRKGAQPKSRRSPLKEISTLNDSANARRDRNNAGSRAAKLKRAAGVQSVIPTTNRPVDKTQLRTGPQDFYKAQRILPVARLPPAAEPPLPKIEKFKTQIGPWELGNVVGKGGSCSVRLVRHRETGQVAVAKIVAKVMADKVRARSLANLALRIEDGGPTMAAEFKLPVALEREIVIMRLLDHQNIVRLYDVWENKEEIYLILEHVDGGELFDYVSNTGPIVEQEAVLYFRQLVEAMIYCHRMQICHRDLKPENILIDNVGHRIKLIDFGMAAYQPTNDLLRTPCGSPHYAAPELLNNLPYDGSKADVWSMGVVLFVMLIGDPPFNYKPDLPEKHRLSMLYSQICSGKVDIPTSLSWEAKDLFHKIFVVDPAQRIDIRDIWNHPFVHKYDRFFGLDTRPHLEDWIGTQPTVAEWKPLNLHTIDPEIFKSLLTLWHDAKEDVLAEMLCNLDLNQEKFFYTILKRWREEQMESFESGPTRYGLVHSPSDYHHLRPASVRARKAHSRASSQFSVRNNEHLYSKHSFFEPPSDASYDPFRASRDSNLNAKSNYLHATGHRANSNVGRGKAFNSYTGRKGSLRVDTLKRHGSGASRQVSLLSVSMAGTSSAVLSVSSRNSTRASSVMAPRHHNPVTVPGPVARHKRNVSFNHIRGGSIFSTSFDAMPPIPAPATGSSGIPTPIMPSSPPLVGSVGGYGKLTPATPRTRKIHDMEFEARRVSNELEKACDEAFYRSSVSGSLQTVSEGPGQSSETPPSTMSKSSAMAAEKSTHIDKEILNRPLPPIPLTVTLNSLHTRNRETPRTFTARELQTFKEKLALRYAQEGNSSDQKYYVDILKQLDTLISPGVVDAKRNFSAPAGPTQPSSLDDIPTLQAIPEEGRFTDHEDLPPLQPRKARYLRAVTDPTTKMNGLTPRKSTIRVVEPSSPLTSPSTASPTDRYKTENTRRPGFRSKPTSEVTHGAIISRLADLVAAAPVANNQIVSKQPVKSSWWRRTSSKMNAGAQRAVDVMANNSDWEDFDDRITRRDQRMASSPRYNSAVVRGAPRIIPPAYRVKDNEIAAVTVSSASRFAPNGFEDSPSLSYLPSEDALAVGTAKKSFFNSFFKKNKDKSKATGKAISKPNRLNRSNRNEQDLTLSTTLPPMQQNSGPRGADSAPVEHWNFFRRLLNIQPESKGIVLREVRKKSRDMLIGLLRDTTRCGIEAFRDPQKRDYFTVVLHQVNQWNYKPATFVIEIFSIDNELGLGPITALRFTQTGGAASSIRSIVKTLEDHFEAGGHILPGARNRKKVMALVQCRELDNEDETDDGDRASGVWN